MRTRAEELGRTAQEALESPKGQEVLRVAEEVAAQVGMTAQAAAWTLRAAATDARDAVGDAQYAASEVFGLGLDPESRPVWWDLQEWWRSQAAGHACLWDRKAALTEP